MTGRMRGTEFADKGEFSSAVEPPTLAYLGSPVWNNPEEWHAAAPFVVHWVVHLRGHSAVLVVDEINWWPLVLSLKCRRVIAAEAHLSGPDKYLLQVCSDRSAQDPDGNGRFYPWITADEAAKLEKIRPRGVLVNRELKANLVDWGLADVLLAVGPLGGILRDGVRQLMAKSAAFDPNASGGRFERERWNRKVQLEVATEQGQCSGPGIHRRNAQPGQLPAFQHAQSGVFARRLTRICRPRMQPGKRLKRTRSATSSSEPR